MFGKLLFVLALIQFSVARYYPEEQHAKTNGFVVFPGEDGRNHLIDLSQTKVDVTVDPADIYFYLFTQQNPDVPIIMSLDTFDGNVPSEYFNPATTVLLTTHGFTGSANSSNCVNMRRNVLERYDVNVINIDWSKNAGEFYTFAKTSVPIVGAHIGEAIAKLVSVYEIPYSNINLIGHSLGAHLVGAIGKTLNGQVNSIVGQDPALPLFSLDNTDERLDTTDGQFVQIIHSNGGMLGFRSSIGHADYFPNGGGVSQPGCGPDLVGACAHGRACAFHEESIFTTDFVATQCDSYENYEAGLCDGNAKSSMGMFEIDKTASGDYYLNTNAAKPYAMG